MRACNDRARENGLKQKQCRFRVDIRKKFFTVRVMKVCNKLLGCPTPRPGLVGSEQPGLVKYVFAMEGGLE